MVPCALLFVLDVLLTPPCYFLSLIELAPFCEHTCFSFVLIGLLVFTLSVPISLCWIVPVCYPCLAENKLRESFESQPSAIRSFSTVSLTVPPSGSSPVLDKRRRSIHGNSVTLVQRTGRNKAQMTSSASSWARYTTLMKLTVPYF